MNIATFNLLQLFKARSHTLPQMMAGYDQHDYMDERRAALNQLADKILKLGKTDDTVLEKMDREGMQSSVTAVLLSPANKSAIARAT